MHVLTDNVSKTDSPELDADDFFEVIGDRIADHVEDDNRYADSCGHDAGTSQCCRSRDRDR